jgi:hypothetical protein
MVQRIKPGIDAQEQARLFEEAKAFGVQTGCRARPGQPGVRVRLINSAALLKTTDTRIPDLTERVAQVAGLALPAPTAK